MGSTRLEYRRMTHEEILESAEINLEYHARAIANDAKRYGSSVAELRRRGEILEHVNRWLNRQPVSEQMAELAILLGRLDIRDV